MTIYILGTTVTANIYLYNTKAKISSSSIWDSKQLSLLLLNLVVNLGVLFIGLHLIHNDLVFNSEHSIDAQRTLLIFHLFLIYSSYLLFGITLWSFIKSFWQTYNMKKLHRQIDNLLYPKKWYRVYKNHKSINNYSKNKFQKHLGFLKLKIKKTENWFIQSQKIPTVSKITKQAFRLIIFSYCLYHYIYIFCVRKHKLIEESSLLSRKRMNKISLKLEILCQNLEYIIHSNSDKGMKKYCAEWNALFSKTTIMLFHIECKVKNEKYIYELYKHLLHNHSKLISLTSDNHEQRKFHKQFITAMFAGLAYKEEYISSFYFNRRSSSLEKIYFEELFELLVNLMQNKNVEIFTLLQNDEINFNSLLASKRDHDKYYGNRDRKKKYEQLFTSILIKMVELNINDNLTTIIAVILSLRDEVIDSTKDNIRSSLPLTMNKKGKVEIIEAEVEVKLSHENKKGLIYAAIKANEVENFKAAGYIVKVLSTNIDFQFLLRAITEIYMIPKTKRNIHFYTGIYKVDFNDYSFEHCLDKTFTLICAQYFLKEDRTHMQEVSSIFNDIKYQYYLDKLEKKSKEYNMLALDEVYLKSFVEYIKSEIEIKQA